MKKAFTLIELLAVLVIIALLATITFVAVNSILKNARENTLEEQITKIEQAAQTYLNENIYLYSENTIQVEIQTLKEEGYIKNEDLKNPVNNEVMNGCVEVSFQTSSNQYEFTYMEECN